MRQIRLSQTLISQTLRSGTATGALLWIAAMATWPISSASASTTPAPLSAAEARQLEAGATDASDFDARLAATHEEMERLMEAHRKLSVERSRAARARVNRSPAIPDPHKSESAAPFETADEIIVRQID